MHVNTSASSALEGRCRVCERELKMPNNCVFFKNSLLLSFKSLFYTDQQNCIYNPTPLLILDVWKIKMESVTLLKLHGISAPVVIKLKI